MDKSGVQTSGICESIKIEAPRARAGGGESSFPHWMSDDQQPGFFIVPTLFRLLIRS
jgi:hypothetical protein